MSLLQEALKRKEEDEARRRAANNQSASIDSVPQENSAKLTLSGSRAPENRPPISPSPTPPVSMPVSTPAGSETISTDMTVPAEPTANAPVKRRAMPSWLFLLLGILIVGLAAAASIMFFFNAPKASPVSKEKPAAPVQAPEVQAAAPSTQEIVVAADKETALEPQQTQATASAESVPPASVNTQPPAAAQPQIKWPVLKLTGILRGAGKEESSAFINNKVLGPGKTIDGVTVVEVQSDGVILQYGSERKFLRVGATLY